MNTIRKFEELVSGDKIWTIDTEADICVHTVKHVKSLGSRIKIEFKDNSHVTVNSGLSKMMTNIICEKDFVFAYIGTDKNELIDSYVEKMKLMIDNTRKIIGEGLDSIEKMQDKIVKIVECHD